MNPRLLAIVGPTASGKKTIALQAAERFGGEIVSADSRKVYRHLDIGTAKPSPADRARIPHHLIDIIDPADRFSAGEWVQQAKPVVGDILARGRLPVVSGGTGFYLTAFREGLSAGIEADAAIREELAGDLGRDGVQALYDRLATLDPARAGQLHPNDSVRIVRALEINLTTGKTIGEVRDLPRENGGDYDWFVVGVTMPREALYKRIDERVDAMIAAGLADEVARVLAMGCGRDAPGLDTVGYKEWFHVIDGVLSCEEAVNAIKKNTRRYAKRQLTWFRAVKDVRWIDVTVPGAADALLDEMAGWIEGGG